MVTLHGALCKSQATGAEDLLLAGGVDDKACVKIIGQRPRAQKVLPERKAETAE
jgi:hypothetical protein